MNMIRDYRLRKGLTMKELGELVGLTESAISLYEKGKRNITFERLLQLSEALDCSVNDLLGYSNTTIDTGMPEITMIARAGAKMTPEKRQSMLQILKTIYPEEFE